MADKRFQARTYKPGRQIEYPAVSAVDPGDVIIVGTIVAYAPEAIAAGVTGFLESEGSVWGVAANEAWSQGEAVYWNATGNPYLGTAGTGCFTTTASGATLAGFARHAKGSTDQVGCVQLTSASRTSTIGGSITANDITAGDASLGVSGISAAQGGTVALLGGTSSTGANAGGAVTLTGGTPGATGVGGAVTLAGGAGGATSGTGGAIVIAGGAGSAGNANGGALTLRGGAKNGSGTDGVIAIGDSNTDSVKIGPGGAEAAAIKSIIDSGTIAVTVPSITDPDCAKVDVSISSLTFAAAVGDAVIAIPLEALPTNCRLSGAWVSATDQVTITFSSEGGNVTGAAKNFKFLIFDLT